MKAKQRPESQQYLNLIIFFMSMEPLGVIISHVSIFLSFKAKKVKKATLVTSH